MSEPAAPEKRRTLWIVAAMALLLALGLLGILWDSRHGGPVEAPYSNKGFDIADVKTPKGAPAPAGEPAGPSASPAPLFGVFGRRESSPVPLPGAGAPAAPSSGAAPDGPVFQAQEVGRLDRLWTGYVAKSRAFNNYRNDLYKDPQLRALMDKYNRDDDLFAWLNGAFRSPYFRQVTVKRLTDPEMLGFMTQIVSTLEPGTLARTMQKGKFDEPAKQFVDEAAASIGLPPSMLGSGATPSQKDVLDAVMRNPALRDLQNQGERKR